MTWQLPPKKASSSSIARSTVGNDEDVDEDVDEDMDEDADKDVDNNDVTEAQHSHRMTSADPRQAPGQKW